MIQRKTWNMSRTILILFISQNIQRAWCGPLKNDDMIDTTELISTDHEDYDTSSSMKKSIVGSPRMFGNVLTNSNVPVEALNHNQIIFGNALPNSQPSITTSDDNRNQMNQNSQLSNTNPLSALQSMSAIFMPNSNPSVDAGNNNQVLFGNFLPNSNPVIGSSNGAQGGQLSSSSNSNPLSEIQNIVNSAAAAAQNNLTSLPVTQNNVDPPAGFQGNFNPQAGVQNGLAVSNPNRNPSQDAVSNGIIGTSPVLLLGTQQALLIPISSVPSIFQTMLSGLMPTGNSQQSGVGLPQGGSLPQLSNIKV